MSETAEQFNERIRKRDQEDLRSVLKTVYGQRFIWRLLKQCLIGQIPIVHGYPDSTAFNIGQQNIGNFLLAQVLEVRPEAYMEMTKKAKEDEDAKRLVEQAIDDEGES